MGPGVGARGGMGGEPITAWSEPLVVLVVGSAWPRPPSLSEERGRGTERGPWWGTGLGVMVLARESWSTGPPMTAGSGVWVWVLDCVVLVTSGVTVAPVRHCLIIRIGFWARRAIFALVCFAFAIIFVGISMAREA